MSLHVLPQADPAPDHIEEATYPDPLAAWLAEQGCGGGVPRPVPEDGWTPPAEDRWILLVSLDSPRTHRTVVEAFADGTWHVVLCGAADPGELPRNFEVHPGAPTRAMLAQADALVSHGDLAEAVEALSHALPIVVLAGDDEQRDVAARLEALGVGRNLPLAAATPAALRDGVDGLVADRRLARRLAAVRREIGVGS
jgi:UDP:flavonoid glycosyltransferase YjiC (YdhE family)